MADRDRYIRVDRSRAAEIIGTNQRRISSWETLVQPTAVRSVGENRQVRLYDFPALVGLAVVYELRSRRVSMRDVLRVLDFLHDRGVEHPLLCKLAIEPRSRVLHFEHDGVWSSGKLPEQIVECKVLELDDIAQNVRAKAMQRQEDDVARTTTRGRSTTEYFAGTRIRVSTIEAFVAAGYSDEQIIAEYPRLTEADIRLVRRTLVA